MEVVNDLLNFKSMKIYQNNKWFNFSLDSVLLAKFVTINKNIQNIIDFGTGNAPIPLILTTRTKVPIYGVELQKKIYDLALKSIKLNKLEKQINLICFDYTKITELFSNESFDIVTCNPPYFEYIKTSKTNTIIEKKIARHEIYATLEDTIIAAKQLLKNNGIFAMVHRTDRLIEIIQLLKKYKIEPKRLQLVYPKKESNSNIVLIEGKKNGNKGLKILSPLYVHEDNGEYKKEIKKMFE